MRKLLLIGSHLLALAIGFVLGIYTLPILIAPAAPSAAEVAAQADKASFKGQFRRDLRDSDALHWGEGTVSVSRTIIALAGELAPGPDGDVKTFKNFLVAVPEAVDPARYNTVVVWCETFSQFITAAKYQ
jgi:hypothetical protein